MKEDNQNQLLVIEELENDNKHLRETIRASSKEK